MSEETPLATATATATATTTTTATTNAHSIIAGVDPSEINCICIGSGRFLRSVLVPALNGADLKPVIFQTRGQTFLDECCVQKRQKIDDEPLTYEVDTVGFDGIVHTEKITCYGAGTLGAMEGKSAALKLIGTMKQICVIGVGVTEAGLSSSKSQSMIDLADLLYACYNCMVVKTNHNNQLICNNPNGRICIINTDNVPNNGQGVIRKHLLDIARTMPDETASKQSDFTSFLKDRVVFHNTMVDRITSQRPSSGGMVPRCEPVPAKALVIEDLANDLPPVFLSDHMTTKFGVVVRQQAGKLDSDIALKLRVANGTHTAVAQTMALSSLLMTDILSQEDSKSQLLMKYLDAFFTSQILPAASAVLSPDDDDNEKVGKEKECMAVYDDWRKRLIHPHFGLSSFFITQNAAAKGGIRIGPTIESLLRAGKPLTVSTAFAMASILRFLTPATPNPENGIYRGWLDGFSPSSSTKAPTTASDSTENESVAYADGLRYNLQEGWYEFRCACEVQTTPGIDDVMVPLSTLLGSSKSSSSSSSPENIVKAYLQKHNGGNLSRVLITDDDENSSNSLTMSEDGLCFVRAVSTLYTRMVINGESMLKLLEEMSSLDDGGLNCDCTVLVDGTR